VVCLPPGKRGQVFLGMKKGEGGEKTVGKKKEKGKLEKGGCGERSTEARESHLKVGRPHKVKHKN